MKVWFRWSNEDASEPYNAKAMEADRRIMKKDHWRLVIDLPNLVVGQFAQMDTSHHDLLIIWKET